MKVKETIIKGRNVKCRDGDVPSNNGELTHTLTIHKPAKGFLGTQDKHVLELTSTEAIEFFKLIVFLLETDEAINK